MKIVVKKSQAKEPFTFAFLDGVGKTIVKSENYAAKKSCLNGVESVRKNSQVDARYEFCESKNGKFYFNLKATNGQVVGTSALFASERERGDAISVLKEHAASLPVEEVEG